MAIHLIIDGYNLLGARGQMGPTLGQEGDAVREGLLMELSKYRRAKGHPITVVFDAWREVRGVRTHEHRAGVHVMYTKAGEQADQVIQHMARQYGNECAVISSDSEIATCARAHSALVMSSQEFQAKLHSALRGSQRSQPISGKNAPFMSKDDPELTSPRPGKKGNPRKLPKSVRKRHRRLRAF